MYYRTYAKIDLDKIEHNIRSVKRKLDAKTKLLAVIKADAYGHGAVEIGKFLEDKCDFFGVACIEEALELIYAGIKIPIIVLGYVSPELYEKIVQYNIRIPVFSLEDAKALSREAVRQNKTVLFHFCIDTGMSRIGFPVSRESADLCKQITLLPNIRAEGLFSHFATADEADLTRTYAQKEQYKFFLSMLSERGIDIPVRHLSNSAGIMNVDEHFDMVRAGIVMYGLYPSDEMDRSLLDILPAMEWKTHISYIKELEKGREVSYGGTYKTDKKRLIATVPVGYADGYPRCLSNRFRVIVNGRYADITGRICMDQFMIDVTDIPNVNIGDEVTLVGTDGDAVITMEEAAQAAYSFNYELPCRIARRVPRVYYRGGKQIKSVNYIVKND